MNNRQSAFKYKNIAGAATTVVRTGPGTLHNITVNKAVLSGVITVYDGLDTNGTKIATITNPSTLLHSQITLGYDVNFTTGLTIVTSAADDITVSYA